MSKSVKHNKMNRMNYIDHIPWIEKYRPKKLEDLILTENSRMKIQKFIEDKDMPNLIITGVPGIGKTTTLKCIALGLFGKYAKEAVLELNASDDRGIKAVHDPIKTFCKKKLSTKQNNDKTYASHKIIILDEADNMTEKAQHLINTLIETYKDTTRFAFTCNSSAGVIEAIQSRCLILRYVRLEDDKIIERLRHICSVENVSYEESALKTLALMSGGDMRRAINSMQITFSAFGELLSEYVFKTCDRPNYIVIKKLFQMIAKKDVKFSIKLIQDLKISGFSGTDIVLSMIDTLKMDDCDLDEEKKMTYLKYISRSTYIISKGIDTDLQLYGLIIDLVDFE